MRQINGLNITVAFSLLCLLFYMSFTSCKKITNPSIGMKDTITYDLQKTSIYFQFVDANTNENIISGDIGELIVKVVGYSKFAIADITGIQKDEYIVRNGFLTLAVLPDYVPSSNSPIIFTIVYQLQKYISSSKEIILTNEGDYIVKVQLVRIDDPPTGVDIKQLYSVGNLYNGVLFDDITISSANEEASITIPAGTKLLDSDTNYLSGKLNLTMVYYNTNEDKALAAISGGICSSIIKNQSSNNVVFFPAGIVRLEIRDSDYKRAAIIEDKMLEINISIPAGTYNPKTKSNVKLGDDLQLFSYLSDTGLWLYNRVDTVKNSLSSGLSIATSTYSPDSYIIGNYKVSSCYEGLSFNLSGDCEQSGSLSVEGIIRKQVDDSYISDISLAAMWNKEINMPYTTGGTEVYIEWNQSSECNTCVVNPSVNPLLIDNMCSQQTNDLPLIDNGSVSISIIADFGGVCASDTNFVILPSFGLWVRQTDSKCWRWTSMKNGIAQVSNLVYGDTYVFGTYYNGIWKEWMVIINEETDYSFTIEFSDWACNNIFGIL